MSVELTLEQRVERLEAVHEIQNMMSKMPRRTPPGVASIHRRGHPLDRICRDTQVMRNHPAVDATKDPLKEERKAA
ncbi:hypothetical protein ETD86_03170 [Nonomuraea turkmeniaca]|uniref:Uncharacterized protein n=1 Tax=Nonomuraea turkmeniaca TaxID=103838 RepID=A0A5S4GFJ9_9ACTN|nr:hypothetical protein [Nonomuraea turkmeniaca]TMR24940.1 hypothetical protein ETD86_03170 [Nonomuraea turkmeniaca]